MKRIFLILLVATSAFAGEKLLGTLVATTVVNNQTTATPFYVPTSAKITIQCDAAAYVLTDSSTALTSTNGLKLSADAIFPTSTGIYRMPALSDAGTAGGASIQALSVSGTANCRVFERSGTE